jgi:hypothetical protein
MSLSESPKNNKTSRDKEQLNFIITERCSPVSARRLMGASMMLDLSRGPVLRFS